ncbi:MAG: multidrug transporter MatE [Myxococcales bacterium]|nr:MAG: multidrug transporter MatE [Myxococcales bacterium]
MTEGQLRNDVLRGPVPSTFLYYAVPSLLGLLAISTATIVDGVFISRFVGSEALAAVNLLLPYFTLLFGLSLMLAMGGSVQAGRSLGEGNAAAASATFSKSVVAVAALTACAALGGNLFDTALYRLLGAPESLFPLMREYFRVVSVAMVVQLATLVVYYFVRLDGRPVLATSAVVAGALTNMALNALLVGHLSWGIAGAAYATAFAQALQLSVLVTHFASGRSKLRFSVKQRRWASLWGCAYSGASELVSELSVGAVVLVINWLLVKRVGVHGVAAFTIVNYVTFASLMVYYGAADALHLLVSQNLGAGKQERARAFFRCALVAVSSFGAVLAGALLTLGDRWLGLFADGESPDVLPQAALFLHVMWPLLLLNGSNVVFTVYLAASRRPGSASLLASLRSLVLPALLLLAFAFWAPSLPFLIALPLAEAATFLLGAVLLLRREPEREPAPLAAREGAVAP